MNNKNDLIFLDLVHKSSGTGKAPQSLKKVIFSKIKGGERGGNR